MPQSQQRAQNGSRGFAGGAALGRAPQPSRISAAPGGWGAVPLIGGLLSAVVPRHLPRSPGSHTFPRHRLSLRRWPGESTAGSDGRVVRAFQWGRLRPRGARRAGGQPRARARLPVRCPFPPPGVDLSGPRLPEGAPGEPRRGRRCCGGSRAGVRSHPAGKPCAHRRPETGRGRL